MKNFLFTLILLSSIAFAEDTKVELTGLALEKGQVVTLQVNAEERHILMFRAKDDFAETDTIIVWLDELEAGKYTAEIRVNNYNVARAKRGNYAITDVVLETEIEIEVK